MLMRSRNAYELVPCSWVARTGKVNRTQFQSCEKSPMKRRRSTVVVELTESGGEEHAADLDVRSRWPRIHKNLPSFEHLKNIGQERRDSVADSAYLRSGK